MFPPDILVAYLAVVLLVVVAAANVGAGFTFMAAGLSIPALDRRR